MMRLVFALFFLPTIALAQANISVDAPKDENHAIKEIIIRGSGLGSKAPPLLLDTAGIAYEKGVPNTAFVNFPASRQITQSDTSGNNNSPWQNVGPGMYIQKDPAHARHSKAGSYYYGDNHRANLHNPRVHPRSGTPNESKKLYVSWWFKQQNETRDYFTVGLTNTSNNFNPLEGDEFSVDIGPHWSGVRFVKGRVISYDPASKVLIANFYDQNNLNLVESKLIRLDSNGATALLNKRIEGQGSNKYIRVWESDGTSGTFRLSWTNVQLYATGGGIETKWSRSHVPARRWNHLEIFIDQTKKTVITKVNSKIDSQITYVKDLDVPGHSPTIGLIGFDASIDIIQEIWMDDIYMDNSFKRITLGNAPKHSQVTHEEVQLFSSWKDSEIRFTPNYGSLSREKPAYIYIYSEDGIPNANGIPFESPPKSPIID